MDRIPPNFSVDLLQGERIEYACFDAGFRLTDSSSGLGGYLLSPSEGNLKGQKIDNLFPELIGYEQSFQDLLDGVLPEMKIERIHRESLSGREGYITLKVKAYQAGWLVIARDITAEGQLEQKVTQQRNELRLQITARQRAEEALQQANEQLEIRVIERTAELQAAYQQLRALSQRLVQIQENERREMARELHDEIGQALTGLKLLLGMSARTLPVEDQSILAEAQTLVENLMDQVRQLSLDLRPAMLDDLGLVAALLWHFERYTHQTGVRVDFKHGEMEDHCHQQVEIAAYRIIQEALTNVARYAETDSVQVRLWLLDDRLHIRVEDQGQGFDLPSTLVAASSNGLSGMRERATLLGGSLVIESAPRRGTQIMAELPLKEKSENE